MCKTKAQSSRWKRPEKSGPKKARRVWSNEKFLLTVCFDCNNVMHHESLPQDRTVNKLCADFAKQFIRNTLNCGKTNHTCNSSHIEARAWVFGQKQNHNNASFTVFTAFGTRCLSSLPKTEDADESKMFCYDWGDKRKIETEAVGDSKKRVSEVFQGLEKTLA